MNIEQLEKSTQEMVCFPVIVVIAVLFSIGCLLQYFHNRRKFPSTLYCKKSRMSVILVKKCQMLTKSFIPTFWASDGHIQTFLPWLLPQEEVDFSREYLQMADKGIIALDWLDVSGNTTLNKVSPIMLIIPALTQTAVDFASMCAWASGRKFRPVVFNRRGHGSAPLTTRRLQTFAEGSDLDEAVTFIHRMYPYAEIFGVGYSSGSGLLISYLGDVGPSTNLTAAVCISPCYDAEGSYKRKFFEPYNWLVIHKLKSLLQDHPSLWESINYDQAMRSESVKDFEERVHLKLNPQYYSSEEYWRLNNPMRNVANVSIPVLCISALDDPICPKEIIPFSLFKTSSNFFLVATEKGGHCGFLENTVPTSWADRLTCEYLESILSQGVPKSQDENHLSPLDIQGARNRSYTT